MPEQTLEGCIKSAEKYLETSYDSSEELSKMALQATLGTIIEALGIIRWQLEELQNSEE